MLNRNLFYVPRRGGENLVRGVESTKNRRPLNIIYYEACLVQADALKCEKYLKTHYGKMFLKKRLASAKGQASLHVWVFVR